MTSTILPDVYLYYRSGVSDGQFTPVLTMERNKLTEAFREFGDYGPKLVIIVGQKRHRTPLYGERRKQQQWQGCGKPAW